MLAKELMLPDELEEQLCRARLYLKDAEVFVRPQSKLRVDAAIYGAEIVVTIAARHLAHVREALQRETDTRG